MSPLISLAHGDVHYSFPLYFELANGVVEAALESWVCSIRSSPGSVHRFDRGLGGFEMDLRLRDHLAKLFNEQKKSDKDVRENHRAMAKLLKEAQRLKTVLSANVDFMAQVSPRLQTSVSPTLF